jgi:thiol-disulfide isomerase/thioredoxin
MKTVSVLMLLFGASPRGEVIELTGENCYHCQTMAPIVSRLQKEGLPIRKVDVDRQAEEARRYGASGIPTFLVVVDGKVVNRTVGAISESELRHLASMVPVEAPAPAAPAKLVSPKPSSPNIRVELGDPAAQPRPTAGQGVVAEVKPAAAEETDSSLFPRLFRRQPKSEPAVRGQSTGSAMAEQTGEAAMAASVRLNLHSPKGILQGSGTIIDSRVGKTLVLTAGAPFNQLPPGSKIEVEVQAGPAAAAAGDTKGRKFVAKLVKADLDADIALIEFPTDQPLARAPIAPAGHAPQLSDRVACIGGSSEARLTRNSDRITALNKYVGPDTIECSGVPQPGRCGGGLFNLNDELVGVCIAVSEDPSTKKPVGGMYCGLKPIHDLLRSQNLAALIESPVAPPAAKQMDLLAMAEPELGTARPMPTAPAAEQDPVMTALATGALATAQPIATAGEPATAGIDDDEEVIVIIRSKKTSAPTRVIHIHKASPKLKAILEGPGSQPAPVLTGVGAGPRATTSSSRGLNPPPLGLN